MRTITLDASEFTTRDIAMVNWYGSYLQRRCASASRVGADLGKICKPQVVDEL